MAIFSFRSNIFVGRMVKKKKKRQKFQIFCNEEIYEDQIMSRPVLSVKFCY